MTHVYLGLYPELQQLVVEPTEGVMLSEYIDIVEQKCRAQKNVLTTVSLTARLIKSGGLLKHTDNKPPVGAAHYADDREGENEAGYAFDRNLKSDKEGEKNADRERDRIDRRDDRPYERGGGRGYDNYRPRYRGYGGRRGGFGSYPRGNRYEYGRDYNDFGRYNNYREREEAILGARSAEDTVSVTAVGSDPTDTGTCRAGRGRLCLMSRTERTGEIITIAKMTTTILLTLLGPHPRKREADGDVVSRVLEQPETLYHLDISEV